jgi:integrase
MKGTVRKKLNTAGRARWEYLFSPGIDPQTGKRRWISKSGFLTQREAQDALDKAKAEDCDKSAAAAEKIMPTFAEFFERYHNEVVRQHQGEKQIERIPELVAYGIRLFGDAPLDQLTPEQLTRDMNRLLDHGGRVTKRHPKGGPLSSTSLRHIEFAIQAVLKQATDWEIIPKNPMLKVRKHKRVKRDPQVVDKSGLDRLLDEVTGKSIEPVIIVDIATGLRRGEVCGLEWTDLDWDRATFTISRSLGQRKTGEVYIKSTKSTKPRRFSIPAAALDVLREHKRKQDEHRARVGSGYHNRNLIFARPDGDYYSPKHLSTRISHAMRRAGLQGVSMHSLRHSYASQQLSNGVPITSVSATLGHANPNITLAIYSHVMPTDNEAAAQAWNNAMSDVLKRSRARKRGRLEIVGKDSETIVVMPLESAS